MCGFDKGSGLSGSWKSWGSKGNSVLSLPPTLPPVLFGGSGLGEKERMLLRKCVNGGVMVMRPVLWADVFIFGFEEQCYAKEKKKGILLYEPAADTAGITLTTWRGGRCNSFCFSVVFLLCRTPRFRIARGPGLPRLFFFCSGARCAARFPPSREHRRSTRGSKPFDFIRLSREVFDRTRV